MAEDPKDNPGGQPSANPSAVGGGTTDAGETAEAPGVPGGGDAAPAQAGTTEGTVAQEQASEDVVPRAQYDELRTSFNKRDGEVTTAREATKNVEALREKYGDNWQDIVLAQDDPAAAVPQANLPPTSAPTDPPQGELSQDAIRELALAKYDELMAVGDYGKARELEAECASRNLPLFRRAGAPAPTQAPQNPGVTREEVEQYVGESRKRDRREQWQERRQFDGAMKRIADRFEQGFLDQKLDVPNIPGLQDLAGTQLTRKEMIEAYCFETDARDPVAVLQIVDPAGYDDAVGKKAVASFQAEQAKIQLGQQVSQAGGQAMPTPALTPAAQASAEASSAQIRREDGNIAVGAKGKAELDEFAKRMNM